MPAKSAFCPHISSFYYSVALLCSAKKPSYENKSPTFRLNKKTLNQFIKNKSLRIKRDNLEYIAKNYEKLNDYESAYRYLYEAHGLSKTIAKNTLDKNIHAIEAKYNVAKQQEKTLKERNKRLEVQLFLYGALFLIVILIIFGLFLYIRNKAYKKRFEELMKMYPNRTAIKTLEVPEKTSSKKTIQISPDMVKSILEGLHDFEKKQEFLTKNITMQDVAKKLQTNSTYLSKVVNSYKNKNFAAYLNDLRIDHTVKALKNNTQLRSYTINAIADYAGYGSAGSFSSAFRKITGLYPSYFIKQLQKQSS